MAQSFKIGEVANRCQTTTRTLRYYEKLGLISCQRIEGGFRHYTPETIERVQRIREMQELLGWSLDEIRDLLALEDAVATLRETYHKMPDPSDRLNILNQAFDITQRQMTLIDQRLQGLNDLRLVLHRKLERYREVEQELMRQVEDKGGEV